MNIRRVTAFAALFVGLVGCQQEKIREIDWAKAALARNPAYEIIATDESAGVFTVRDTTSGAVSTLQLSDLIATPRPAPSAATPSTPAPATLPSEPAEDVEAGGETLASGQTTDLPPAPVSGGAPLAEGPGYRITRGDGTPAAAREAIEGPGYKIERSAAESSPATRESQPAAAEPVSTNAIRHEPIICQGDRLMRIDGETIEFTGDAVIAEKGCDLYISNARILAGGVGIIARQARVHIANSTISGVRASYEVSDGAQIYVAQSTFTGIGRRFDGASMTDLGGNSYTTR